LRFAHPTVSFNAIRRGAVAVTFGLHYRDSGCGNSWGSAVDEKRVAAFNALPQPSSCRLIDFDDVQVIPGTILRTYFLIVKGTKPWITMDVGLHPLPYATRPDYTAIEVVGCQNGIGLPQAGPYSAVIEFTHLIGVRGIEVVGASVRKKIEIS
jgi:hypothetical protein